MLAVELREPRGIEALVRVERPRPRPAAREILIRVRAASLNYRDLAIVRGSYGSFPLPIVPLSDAAGEVIEVGPAVTRFAPGDAVCPHYVVDWLSGPGDEAVVRRRLGGPLDGVLAELVCVHEQAAVRAPRHMSALEAACLPIAGVTAWEALFVRGRVKPGDVVVVQGTGGVSVLALQLARAAGARVIATSASAAKAARARELGAEAVVDRHDRPRWHERVLELTDGRGADHVLDVVGGDNVARSVAATRFGGCVSLIGFLDGTRGTLDLPEAFRRMVTLHAISVGSRASFEALVAASESNALRPIVSRVFEFGDFRQAFEHLAGASHFGKIVIGFD